MYHSLGYDKDSVSLNNLTGFDSGLAYGVGYVDQMNDSSVFESFS